MLGFVVVDDGIVADIGDGVALVVDGRILGVNVGQVGAVVLVDVAVPDILIDGDICFLTDLVRCELNHQRIESHVVVRIRNIASPN